MNWVRLLVFLMPKTCCQVILVIAACLVLFGPAPTYGNPSPSVRMAIVISKQIRPYLEAVAGLEEAFAEKPEVKTEVWDLERLHHEEGKGVPEGEETGAFALFAAVGPEAAQYVWNRMGKGAVPKIYCMVLNPEKVVGVEEKACGIPLNIPVHTQIAVISRGLPSVKRVGLLYDPQHNAGFLQQAAAAAASLNLTIVPLSVSSKRDIPSVLEDRWDLLDALWLIPDRTVISESIVAYLIKEAFLQNIPVIGYNRFFYETGAAMAFVFDYRELGRQCAQEALRMLSGEGCRETPPRFHAWVNEKMIEKLGKSPPDAYLPPLQPGP
jgi:putative tryptophan/tyrosine transport system substrate-binding protein